ncbi:hypothetical protein GIY23_16730 [Allosaccharopolyspora coralli]|uniref:Uncharacterized protein n=1 Tax=Allosaccharopolyspora coralli TaxID=2665642 RepID=A0A5Q3Q8Z2_9PSEU|nr:hypothetical protein [Allosaccharopolyspora coralli]QGK70942.1 hypothetical protein GIY23_16730 [Allosaccharopolyspora coralli]
MARYMLEGLESFTWSSDQAVAYEAALEVLNEARAVCSARIAALEHTVEPQDERLQTWEQALHRCAVHARELDPEDAPAWREFARSTQRWWPRGVPPITDPGRDTLSGAFWLARCRISVASRSGPGVFRCGVRSAVPGQSIGVNTGQGQPPVGRCGGIGFSTTRIR